MAATVISGASNPTYTNSTGGNVRVIINYMRVPTSMTFAGQTIIPGGSVLAIGRNLAFSSGFYQTSGTASASGGISAVNMALAEGTSANETINSALPTEIMLQNGQAFSAACGVYNIVVIPEAG